MSGLPVLRDDASSFSQIGGQKRFLGIDAQIRPVCLPIPNMQRGEMSAINFLTDTAEWRPYWAQIYSVAKEYAKHAEVPNTLVELLPHEPDEMTALAKDQR